ncbi:hypothetical protein IKS73_05180 [bacterium]|nr:hypothetical protein [bacterium]
MKKINLVVLLTALMAVSTFAGVGSVKINTTNSETGEPIPGISYGIFTDAACKDLVRQASGDIKGEILFDKVSPGLYYLCNVATSGGFKKDDTVTELTVSDGASLEFAFSFEPSSTTKSSGPQRGKFSSSIKGTLPDTALKNITAKPVVRIVCSNGSGQMTPEYALLRKKSSSYIKDKDISIKCVPYGNSMKYKFGTTVAVSFLSVQTTAQPVQETTDPDNPGETTTEESEETPTWEPAVFEPKKCSLSGKMAFNEEPKYLYNCAVKLTFGDEKEDFVSDEIPLVMKGKNYKGSLTVDKENGRTVTIKAKVNSTSGKSKFTVKGNDLIGVESRYEEAE